MVDTSDEALDSFLSNDERVGEEKWADRAYMVIRSLRDERNEAQKDTDRLNWLEEARGDIDYWQDESEEFLVTGYGADWTCIGQAQRKRLRDAIDAAMQGVE